MSIPTYALIATVSFHDVIVEQRRVPRGRPLEIGRDDRLAVPLPAGHAYLARCTWVGPDRVEVADGRGTVQELVADGEVEVVLGPVKLQLQLAEQYALKRTTRLDAILSLAWLAMVLMATNTMSASYLGWENRCPWFGVGCAPPSTGDSTALFTAEYLARLLKEDYAGDEEGYLTLEVDRPDAEKKVDKDKVFMPAGNTGPIEKMGGAEEVTPDPVRTPEEQEEVPLPDAGKPLPPLHSDVGEPIEVEMAEEVGEDDGFAEVREDEEVDALEPPSEEERGWGVRDWYDEQDARIDELEIMVTLEMAKRALRLDPDDPYALQTLSYYQYLAQDFDAALVTYNRYIALYPEQSLGYNNKALVYKRLEDYATEEKLYRVALALTPNDVTAMNNLAVNLSHQGRYEEALELMRALEVLDPDDAYAELHRSKIYAAMGQDSKALEYLDRALQGMAALDTLHSIEFRQDIRVDPSFAKLRETRRFHDVLVKYYGEDSPLQEG